MSIRAARLIRPGGLCFCLLIFLSGCAPRPAEEILEKCREQYAGAENLYEKSTITIKTKMAGKVEEQESELEVYFRKPDSIHSSKDGNVLICNADDLHLYMSSIGQAKRMDPPHSLQSVYENYLAKFHLGRELNAVDSINWFLGSDVEDGPRTATVARKLTHSRGIQCYVLNLALASGAQQTLWIGKRDSLIYRNEVAVSDEDMQRHFKKKTEDRSLDEQQAQMLLERLAGLNIHTTETVVGTAINAEMPDDWFTFKKSKGVVEVQEFHFDLVGEQERPFTLKSTDGKRVSLQEFRGKVVLLDFWASWCEPCIKELPIIEKIYQSLAGKGLVVLGINLEDAETARIAAKQHGLTFPVLVDEEGDARESYQVKGIPRLILIDRTGKITGDFTGLSSKDELRKAINKAGVK